MGHRRNFTGDARMDHKGLEALDLRSFARQPMNMLADNLIRECQGGFDRSAQATMRRIRPAVGEGFGIDRIGGGRGNQGKQVLWMGIGFLGGEKAGAQAFAAASFTR